MTTHYPVSEGIPMTEAEYLATEPDALDRREYLDGYAYEMAESSSNHNLIAGNLACEFRNHLKGKTCAVFMSQLKLVLPSAAGENYVYPDVIVDCSTFDGNSYFIDAPTLLVEVLSDSTRKLDLTTKLSRYIQIPSLQEYVLVEQGFVQVLVLRKNQGWFPYTYFLGDDVTFESIGLALPVEAIYERVDNKDMVRHREKNRKLVDPIVTNAENPL
jgi:Uma2 family endonuclease